MAWNRPSADKVRAKGEGEQRNVHLKGLLAGAVVIVGAAVAWWLFVSDSGGRGTTRPVKGMKPALIKETAPQSSTNRVVVKKVVKEGPDKSARPTRVGEKVNGYVMLPDGTIHKMTGTAHSVTAMQDPSQIFDNGAENEIAALITMEPGEVIVGGPDRETFTAEFLKSTAVPIIVKSDDPEEVKALKRAVNEVKADLKAAHDRGEDIVAIVEKTYDDFQRLAQYKEDLFNEVNDYSQKEEVTDEDVKDYLAAANKLLEEKGIAPLDDTAFIRAKIEYDHYVERNN